MGFSEMEPVLAEGMNISEEYQETSLRRCYDQIDSIAQKWYPDATTFKG